jgi:hypothetical protein
MPAGYSSVYLTIELVKTDWKSAGELMLDNVKFFKSVDPGMTVLLVSNDADLCKSATRLGAQIVPVLELGAFF